MKDALGRDIPDDHHLEFTRGVLAESLWEYGEEDLAERSLTLSEVGLASVAQLTLWHRLNDPVDSSGSEPSDALTMAKGAIDYFECATRDPAGAQRRTRPESERYDQAR